jgi:hypothetical protein
LTDVEIFPEEEKGMIAWLQTTMRHQDTSQTSVTLPMDPAFWRVATLKKICMHLRSFSTNSAEELSIQVTFNRSPEGVLDEVRSLFCDLAELKKSRMFMMDRDDDEFPINVHRNTDGFKTPLEYQQLPWMSERPSHSWPSSISCIILDFDFLAHDVVPSFSFFQLNSKNMTDFPVDDHADFGDETTYNNLRLPGAKRGDDGSRTSKVEVLTTQVCFSIHRSSTSID